MLAIARLLLVSAACVAGELAVADEVAKYFDGLRDRQLYDLAEQYAAQELSRSDLTERRRADFLVQQAVTRTLQAVNSTPGERAAAWNHAAVGLTEYLAQSPRESLGLLAELQLGLVQVARGEATRNEVRPGDDIVLEQSRTVLRAAIQSLSKVARDAGDLQQRRQLGHVRIEPGDLSDDELNGIARGSRLQLGRALRQLALTYPSETAERDDGLLRAQEYFEPLASSTANDKFTWQARLETLRVQVDLARFQMANAAIEAWSEVPSELTEAWLAERARLRIAEGQPAGALDLLRPVVVGESPRCDFVRIEAALAAGVDGKQIASLLQAIRDLHPPVWARRATILAGQQLTEANTGDGAALLLAADHFYHARQLARARDQYVQASQAFTAAADVEQARIAEQRAAAVEMLLGRPIEAADRYREIAFAKPTHPQAANWHRERLLALASAARGQQGNNQALAHFREACREHLQHWPTGEIANEVRVWLAQQLLGVGRVADALATLKPVEPVSQFYPDAIVQMATAYRKQVPLRADRQKLAAEATAVLFPAVFGANNAWPIDWKPHQRAAALALAELRMSTDPPAIDDAKQLLVQSLKSAPATAEPWRTEATQLLVVILATSGDWQAAVAQLNTLGNARGGSETLLAALAKQLQSYPPDSPFREPLAVTMQSAIDKLPANEQARLLGYQALAAGERGDREKATQIYEQLIAKSPKDGDLHEQFAGLLARGKTTADAERAIAMYAKIESLSKRAGERWYRARLARVKLLQKLGRAEEAKKLIAVTKVLHGAVGERLEAEARQPR